jgi:hypothetical protein
MTAAAPRDVAPRRSVGVVRITSRSGPITVVVDMPSRDLPSQRGETWNETEAINRHREMTLAERVALAIEASRAALLFAESKHLAPDDPIRS